MVTGMRGLCNGLGPAMFGIIFYMFHVDLTEEGSNATHSTPLFEPYSQVRSLKFLLEILFNFNVLFSWYLVLLLCLVLF